MNEEIDSEERSYWQNEVLQRSFELTAMQEQDADARVAILQLGGFRCEWEIQSSIIAKPLATAF